MNTASKFFCLDNWGHFIMQHAQLQFRKESVMLRIMRLLYMLPATLFGSAVLPIRIERLSPDQWMLYRELRLAAVRESPMAFGLSYDDELLVTEKDWRCRILKMYFAKLGEKIVGMIGFDREPTPRRQHIVYIFSLYVSSEFRDHGIGTVLIRFILERIMKVENIKKIYARITVGQTDSLKLHTKFGFYVLTVLRNEYLIDKKFHDVYLVEKLL